MKSEESSNQWELEMNAYKCPECRDMTFILMDDGTAKECKCRALRIAESILQYSGISEEFRKKTFENFNYSIHAEVTEAFLTALNYVENFENIRHKRNNSILFMGSVGGGKTHLSIAIANKLMDNSIGVVYMPYRDIITNIKQNMLDEENYRNTVNKYKEAKVLLIDDLWKGKITESDINIMFEIINYRYLKNLPVIVSTEKAPKQFKDVDPGVCTRIIEMCEDYLVYLNGEELNYRTRKSRALFA